MKAALYTRYGSPEVVQVSQIDKPVPGADEILVKIMCSSVNRTDCGFRSAEYFISRFFSGLFSPKYKILGNEFSGIVESCGAEVKLFKPGDRIFGYDDVKFGGHAEYKTISQSAAVAIIPENISFEQAAALTEGAHYALCDIRAAQVQKGQHVLVYGATGAIGSAAVQLLKYFGARVTAVCNTPNVERVRSLGADRVIDYLQEDYTLSGEIYDFVFDAVGKTSFGKCKPVLSTQGIYISTEFGKNGENVFLALRSMLLNGKRVLFPLPSISAEDVVFLGDLAEKGFLKPVLDREYTLDQIVEAHQYVETRQKIGNVIIRVQS